MLKAYFSFISRSLTAQYWPLIATMKAGAMLAAAQYFERVWMMLPCPLCYQQRYAYWGVIALALAGWVIARSVKSETLMRIVCVGVGLIFLTGAGIAIFHQGVEYGVFAPPSACSGGGAGASPADLDFGGTLNLGTPQGMVSCVDAPFWFLGLSMAGWNAVISTLLAGTSFVAARR